ncbi:MAG: hypothetical protein LBE84_00295, partial [Planctomycetota bacterium]|nr:hypothetical protein [Planctomycetota bacterium]
MSSSQQITGLSSGFDTATIVEQLMAIEKIPYTKLDTQKQTAELKLQAYQAINSMLLKFKTSISNLASTKLWQAKTAVSTNENSVTATANEYAVAGTYAVRVAQLASSAQFVTKGFASSKTALVKQNSEELAYKIGSITMNSAKSRVDNSAKLSQLNGGQGVYRGSIRITDAANNVSTVDLSACDTMEDVVRTINSAAGAQVVASITEDGKLKITENSGGGGKVKVQNVGSGTTATDLGIDGMGSEPDGSLVGRNVYTMGSDTALSTLQDGLGIEEGTFYLRVSKGAEYYDVGVNVDDCATVGDIIKRVNNELEYRAQNQLNDPSSGGSWELLDGLRFGLNDDRNAFALTGTAAGASYQFYENPDTTLTVAQKPATQLGLLGRKMTATDNETIVFDRVLGAVDSPMLKNLSGADGAGIGSAGNSGLVSVPFSSQTKISELNDGAGVDGSMPLQIALTEGGSNVAGTGTTIFYNILDPSQLNALLNDETKTIGDLTNFINKGLADFAADPANQAAGLTGMYLDIDETNGRMLIVGAQAGYGIEIRGTLANSLGLMRTADSGTAVTVDSAQESAIGDVYGSAQIIPSSGTYVEIKTTDNFGDFADAVVSANGANGLNSRSDLEALIAGGLKLTLGDGNYGGYALSNPVTIVVDLSTVAIDYNATVGDVLDQVNAAINKAACDGIAERIFGAGATPPADFSVSAPQLRVNSLANGFQWTNLDFSKSFKAEGNLTDGLGISKEFNTGSGPTIGTHPPDTLANFNFSPRANAYVKELTLDGATALGELNYGASLTFAGDETDALTIDLGGTAGSISITMKELRDGLNAASSLNTTLDQYASMLNDLVADKLGLSPGGADGLFKTGGKGLEVDAGKITARGGDKLVIDGTAADAVKTGISAVNVASVSAGQTVQLAELHAGEIVYGKADGLGSVTLRLGGSEYTLSTSGMSGDSTLNELVARLNQELDDQGLADVTFTLNDAGTGIAINNSSNQGLEIVNTKDINTLAKDLGLIDSDGKGIEVESYSHYNASSLGRKYLSRATSLSSILGNGVTPGSISVTNAGGYTRVIDLSNAKTIGDVIDAINVESAFGVQATINERGDGITLIEAYDAAYEIPDPLPTGNISVSDYDGGSLAESLGIAGQGTRDNAYGASIFEGSLRTAIDVMSSDTLESLMYRISEQGYKTAIINDGSSTAPYRLTISSANTGETSDFVIESDLDIFGF